MKKRIDFGLEKALESIYYILYYYTASDFVEVVGRVGGDTVTVRVYNDGSTYER